MSSSKHKLIETLVELIGEDELRAIIENVIESQKSKLNKLQLLSLKLSGEQNSEKHNSSEIVENDNDLSNSTASASVLKILKEATGPMNNSDIRKQYYMLFDKPITSSTVGNVLWKGKKNKLFKKVGSGRWTKWEYIPQNE